jgi:hypothetical protein
MSLDGDRHKKDTILRQAQDELPAGSRLLIISGLKTSVIPLLTSYIFTIFAGKTKNLWQSKTMFSRK